MNDPDKQLNELLRQAAEGDMSSKVPVDLADRVRQRWTLRRKRRRAVGQGAGLLMIAIFTGLVWHWTGRSGDVGIARQETAAPVKQSNATDTLDNDQPNAVALRKQVRELQKEIKHLRAQLKADKQRRQFECQVAALRKELSRPSRRDLNLAEIEKTAFIMVQRAETCERFHNLKEAHQEYEQVISLFPDTSWAEVARTRLHQKTN